MKLQDKIGPLMTLLTLCLLLPRCGTPPVKNESPGKLYSSAYTAVNRKEYQQALKQLDRLIQMEPRKVEAYVLKANIYELQAMTGAAIETLEAALDIDRTNHVAWFNLGNQFAMEDFYRAVFCYTLSIESNPAYPPPYLNRANSYLNLKEYAKALTDYKTYLTLGEHQKEKILKIIGLLEQEIPKEVTLKNF